MARHSDPPGLPLQVAREQVRFVRNRQGRSASIMRDLNRDLLGTKRGKETMIEIMKEVHCLRHDKNTFTPLDEYICPGCPLLDAQADRCTAGLEVRPRSSNKEQ